jgi:predicted phage terminase large subunit-like protein
VRSESVGERAHIRILDDANSPTKRNTEEFGKINYWAESIFLKRRVRPTSPLISIQQRIHEMDITAYLRERSGPKMVHLVLPNRYEGSRTFDTFVKNSKTGELWVDQRTQEDELLNPNILDEATTAQEIKADSATDSAQNQQNPVPDGGIIFKRDDFRYWSPEPQADRSVALPEKATIFATADFNNLKETKRTKNTDFAIIQIWAMCSKNFYLVEEIRSRMNVVASINTCKQVFEKYGNRMTCMLIEAAANGPTVINSLRAIMGLAYEVNRKWKYQRVRDWKVQGETKIQRAEAVAYVVESARVFIPDPLEYGEMNFWLDEVCGFPNRRRDDRVDTLTMALAAGEKEQIV